MICYCYFVKDIVTLNTACGMPTPLDLSKHLTLQITRAVKSQTCRFCLAAMERRVEMSSEELRQIVNGWREEEECRSSGKARNFVSRLDEFATASHVTCVEATRMARLVSRATVAGCGKTAGESPYERGRRLAEGLAAVRGCFDAAKRKILAVGARRCRERKIIKEMVECLADVQRCSAEIARDLKAVDVSMRKHVACGRPLQKG